MSNREESRTRYYTSSNTYIIQTAGRFQVVVQPGTLIAIHGMVNDTESIAQELENIAKLLRADCNDNNEP